MNLPNDFIILFLSGYFHRMDNSPSTASLLTALEQLSGGKLRRQEDLGALIELGKRHNGDNTLADLSFHAKFVSNAYRIMKRIGPGADGFDKLSQEFNTGIAKVSTLLRTLIDTADRPYRERFESAYFSMNPDALENLLALCYDLSWYKNWLLEQNTAMHVRPHPVHARRVFTWRIALTVIVIAGVLWLGGATVRSLIGYTLLEPGTLQLRTDLTPDAEREGYRSIATVSLLIAATYVVVLISGAFFLARSPFRLKDHGWLLMSAILLYLCVPIEAFTMILDYKLMAYEFLQPVDLASFRSAFLARAGALAGAPFVAVLCYYTIIVLAVFQPFRRDISHQA